MFFLDRSIGASHLRLSHGAPGVVGIPIRVLIVEDSLDDAQIVLEHLRREGYAPVHRIVDSEELFANALKEPWDVILSDFSMPNFDGLKAFEILLARRLDIPFIFVSGHIGEDRAAEAMLRGVSDYVLKDHLARLVPAIQRETRTRGQRRASRDAAPTRRTSPDSAAEHAAPSSSERSASANDIPPQALSVRQRQVLVLVAEGCTSKEIARELGLAAKTAGAHRASLMQKLNIHTVVGLVRYAIRNGLIRP